MRDQGIRNPLKKSQVTIGFLRNTGTDSLEEQLDPWGPIVSRGRSVRPSVKSVHDKSLLPSFQDPRMDLKQEGRASVVSL